MMAAEHRMVRWDYSIGALTFYRTGQMDAKLGGLSGYKVVSLGAN